MTGPVSGSNERFNEIFHRHKDQVYGFAVRMLEDRDIAGDITQEVFLRLYKSIDANPAITNMRSWLFILTRNLCLNKIRDSKRVVSLDTMDVENLSGAETEDSNRAILRKAMLCLETRYREVLILKEYQGFSYSEIGEILGLTVPAVRSLLYKARMMLREKFEQLSI
ncbi:MAG: RNA polymerase sigma factor [Candidatus Zixiibacteriota bacterium]